MKNITIIDTETTGIDPKKCATIEVGALLYNVEHKVVLKTLSFLLPCEENPVEHINNIKASWTKCYNITQSSFDTLADMVKASDLVVAHNASFDKGFMKEIKTLGDDFWKTHWMCTKDHFEWPVELPRRRLQDICQAMNVPYDDAHRALTDCTFLAKCFSKINDLQPRLIKAAAICARYQ